MNNNILPLFSRINELATLHRAHPNSYFHDKFDNFRNQEPIRIYLKEIENDLQQQDALSWRTFKEEVEKLVINKDRNNHWSKFHEKLNEAKGYAFLKSKGYTTVSFIPVSRSKNIETPDLLGRLGASTALCEVKTKNVSDDFIYKQVNSKAIRTNEKLADKLKDLLEGTFNKAKSQLDAYSDLINVKKYIYLIIEYDNQGVDKTYPSKFNAQTRKLFDTLDMTGINLVIHDE